ncbi:MAG TPA: RidA family protein [Longimicrobiales bacterium]|nr:RidA family protein [Longimicrobiales bacterium]
MHFNARVTRCPALPGRTIASGRAAAFVAGAALVLAAGCQPSSSTPGLGGNETARGPRRQVIAPDSQVVTGLPFAPAVRSGNLIFLSGAIGNKPGTRQLVSPDVGDQTRQALQNLRSVLQAADADLGDIVKCTVFLADIKDYDAMNRVYATVFGGSPPARSTVAGSGLALGAKVEIECIAAATSSNSSSGSGSGE